MKINREYLTVREAGRRSGISRETISTLVAHGALPYAVLDREHENTGYAIPIDYLPTTATDAALTARQRIPDVPEERAAQIRAEIEWINTAVFIRTIQPPYHVKKRDVPQILQKQGIEMNTIAGHVMIASADAERIVWPEKTKWPVSKNKERYSTRGRIRTTSESRRISPRTKELIDKIGNIDIAPTIAYGVRMLGKRDNLHALINEWRTDYSSYKGFSVAIVLTPDELDIAKRLMRKYSLTLPQLADLAIYTVAKDQGLT